MDQFGRSRALNKAVELARGDIFAFTDDDCEAAEDWLEIINHHFMQEPGVGIVAGNLIPPKVKGINISACPATYTIECIYKPAESGYRGPKGFYWGGANLAVRRSCFELVGPFDNNLGVGSEFPSAEDVDFGLRAELLGVVMWTTPKSIIYHTYGRRYGLKNVLNHFRGYALGGGALGAKLKVSGHWLSEEWDHPQPFFKTIRKFFPNPLKGLLFLYTTHYKKEGFRAYQAKYVLAKEQPSDKLVKV
ncbi:MAG: hypothetical protein BGO39_19295 [Chloroflexi bacterium 54-19]|nr:MAG: hypothetical protein BGO39_19295 [Chloroflexi bacterium 54-19]